ncbi:DUF3124 domain-containing protein [Alkalimarinus sediminis]|uniref:DUF3124 domain-containing protein n=1 Tax=Alkalimarinus sediminis TaxID=1632866 RepID=A0A9E8HIB0_9ALTE|nr:DUF3124 domain-containing protein [Alkalimarinus sediminis]UZW74934.1 DUF3124 domain-containing protein [Alkalimarinus sediminis]
MSIPIRLLFVVPAVLLSINAWSQALLSKSTGQTVYVPSYTELYKSNSFSVKGLTTVTIHNIDPHHSITVNAVTSYDTHGKLSKQYLQEPLILRSFASKSYLVRSEKGFDGIGANFIVRWESAEEVVAPLIESRMLANSGTQGYSLSSQGRVIETKSRHHPSEK